MEDQVLRKAQRGLLFGKPKYGIFVTAFYKHKLNVDDPAVHSGIVGAARDVITYALDLEKAQGTGKELYLYFRCLVCGVAILSNLAREIWEENKTARERRWICHVT